MSHFFVFFQGSESIDWPAEIGICERSADRYSSNYHAWSHRQWVLQNAPFLLKSELMLSDKFMRKHISDYSSYHYRQKLIAKAYEMCYYDAMEMKRLIWLKQLINYYLIADVGSVAEILDVMLPGLANVKEVGEQRLHSFLFCCNLAAHDMRLCNDQKSMYGERECFELHRRASLKFIVEQCVRLLLGEMSGRYVPPMTTMQAKRFNEQLCKYNYAANPFLRALKHSESLLGESHRRWCSLYLGFSYGDDEDEDEDMSSENVVKLLQ